MQPFYFGSSRRPLFGLYHAPTSARAVGPGVVLCPPAGHESLRAHRAFRNLATALARAGCHVLRFDYSGSGDSGGDGEAARLADWVEDAGTAVEELRDTADLPRVSLVGLRIGAAVASLAAARRRDVERLVLWDPVVSGRAHLRALADLQRSLLARAFPELLPGFDPEAPEALGHPLPAGLRQDLDGLSLLDLPPAGAARVGLLVSEDREEYRLLHRHLASGPAGAEYRHVPAAGDWDRLGELDTTLLAHEMMEPIVDQVTGAVR